MPEEQTQFTAWELLNRPVDVQTPEQRLREDLQQYLGMIGVTELESICWRLIDTAGELAEALNDPQALVGDRFAVRRRRGMC